VLDATPEAAAGRDGLLVVADSALLDLRERIAGLALRHRLPTFSSIPEVTDAGALVGYGEGLANRQAAHNLILELRNS
jgi:hypothetical protein